MPRREHTPEPWFVSDFHGERLMVIGDRKPVLQGVEPHDSAQVDRAVACVNALAGVSNPDDFMAGLRRLYEQADRYRGAPADIHQLAVVVRDILVALAPLKRKPV